jgi:hypothetical protein
MTSPVDLHMYLQYDTIASYTLSPGTEAELSPVRNLSSDGTILIPEYSTLYTVHIGLLRCQCYRLSSCPSDQSTQPHS